MRTAENLDAAPDAAVATPPTRWWRRPATPILGTAGGVWLIAYVTSRFDNLPLNAIASPSFLKNKLLNGWARWDAGWYHSIASDGYFFKPGKESSIAFFPSYPLAIRWLNPIFGNDYVTGIWLTLACGISYLFLAYRWFCDHLGKTAGFTALLLVCWYPFSFYLYGAVYSDALFALAAIGAFLLVERDRPVLAGLAGAVATAARPVGIAVAIGLVLLVLNRREVLQRTPKFHVAWRNLKWKDAGVLLSGLGVGAYLVYLWARFGSPLVFMEAEAGWNQAPGWQTWLKVPLINDLLDGQKPLWIFRQSMHIIAGFVALALIPRAWKKFGSAYGVYALIIVIIPLLQTKDFFSTGRYMIPAFPCFAAGADLLATRPKLRLAVLTTFPIVLAGYVVLFIGGYYVA